MRTISVCEKLFIKNDGKHCQRPGFFSVFLLTMKMVYSILEDITNHTRGNHSHFSIENAIIQKTENQGRICHPMRSSLPPQALEVGFRFPCVRFPVLFPDHLGSRLSRFLLWEQLRGIV